MEFKKYSKMINSFDKEIIKYFLAEDNNILHEIFEITEKLHGANFSIIAYPDGELKFTTRNKILKSDESFYGFLQVMAENKYVCLYDLLRELSSSFKKDVRLIGELFGGKIQKGVFYGNDKQFRWFNLMIDNQYITPKKTDELLKRVMDLKVPLIGYKTNENEDFLDFISEIKSDYQSQFTPHKYDQDNICEGVVIKPYERNIFIDDSQFMIKKKNEVFLERKSASKKVREKKDVEPIVQEWIDIMSEYINDNRLDSVKSKIGEFKFVQDIQKFYKAFYNDVEEDFIIDNGANFSKYLDKSQISIVKKAVKKNIIEFLKKDLKER